jgi:transposase-like protein
MTHDDPRNGLAVLKRDGRGRVRSTPEQRREAMAQFERSGLSGPAFCRVAGIHYQTFVGWRKEARNSRRPVTGSIEARPAAAIQPATIRLVEALPAAVRASSPLQVALPGGALLLIADASQVQLAAQLLQNLNPAPTAPC